MSRTERGNRGERPRSASRAPLGSGWVMPLALAPPVAMALLTAGGRAAASSAGAEQTSTASALILIAASAVVCVALAWRRGRVEGPARTVPPALSCGLLFALTLSPATPPLKAVLALAMGWVLGRAVVGRNGQSLVHPAVLGYALLALSWPDAVADANLWLKADLGAGPEAWWALLAATDNPGALAAASPLAVVVGGAVAVALGALRWRPILGAPIGAAVALSVLWQPAFDAGVAVPLWGHLLLGSFPLGAVFIGGLPTAWVTTRLGQWGCGALFGFVVVLLRLAIPAHPDGTMGALLLMSIFAPLIDHAVSAARKREADDD